MNLYRVGKIIAIGKTYLIFESNFTGFFVYVANPELWEDKRNQIVKLYMHHYQTDYVSAIYGFKTFSEKVLFEDLLSVAGVGPKIAMSILRSGEEAVAIWIAQGDVTELIKIPYLGQKIASQIVFELKIKYERFANTPNKSNQARKILPNEIKEPLKILGFNSRQIDYAISHIEPETTLEAMIEKAIKVIANAKFA